MKPAALAAELVRKEVDRTPNVMTVDGRIAPAWPLPRRRLLVVEDDPIIRAALRSGLGLHGYEVTAVGNGRDALAAMSSVMPDLIVLDLALPVMSGERFVEDLTLNGLRSELRIVVLSADPDGEERAHALGADAFFRKPLRLATLIREIERLMGD